MRKLSSTTSTTKHRQTIPFGDRHPPTTTFSTSSQNPSSSLRQPSPTTSYTYATTRTIMSTFSSIILLALLVGQTSAFMGADTKAIKSTTALDSFHNRNYDPVGGYGNERHMGGGMGGGKSCLCLALTNAYYFSYSKSF